MSLRSALVATLLLGDQYGLQLHGEVVARTARLQPLNVGQVYATLDRLVSAGLVRSAGATGDGLTLYGLTSSGSQAAQSWVTTPSTPLDWGEMREQVLLVSTLPAQDPGPLVDAYRTAWRAGESAHLDDLGSSATLARAAEEWLTGLELGGRQRPLVRSRPRRGRRPAA